MGKARGHLSFSRRSKCLYPLNRWIIIIAVNLDGSEIQYEKVAGDDQKTFWSKEYL